MEEFIECLRVEIEEDFEDIGIIGFEQYVKNRKDNFNKLLELFKNHHRWGI